MFYISRPRKGLIHRTWKDLGSSPYPHFQYPSGRFTTAFMGLNPFKWPGDYKNEKDPKPEFRLLY